MGRVLLAVFMSLILLLDCLPANTQQSSNGSENEDDDNDNDNNIDDDDDDDENDDVCLSGGKEESPSSSRTQQNINFCFECIDEDKGMPCFMQFFPPFPSDIFSGVELNQRKYDCQRKTNETLKSCCSKNSKSFENNIFNNKAENFNQKLKESCKLYECKKRKKTVKSCKYIACNFQTLYPDVCKQVSETSCPDISLSNAGVTLTSDVSGTVATVTCRGVSSFSDGSTQKTHVCSLGTWMPQFSDCIADGADKSETTINAGVVVGPVVAVLLVAVIAAVLALWWWKRRRTKEGSAGADKSIQGTSGNAGVIVNASFDPEGGAERVAVSERNSEHSYTYIDIASIDNASSNAPQTDPSADVEDSVYNKLNDDTNRKLPLAPVGNADNSSSTARKDDTTSLEASVRNGNSSAQGLIKNEYTFARGLSAGDTVEPSSAAASQMGHVYSHLNPLTDAEYTSLGQTYGDGDQSHSTFAQDGQGGQYFILEEKAACESKQPKGEETYFILEQDANINSDEQTGDRQYFILEEERETSHCNKKQTTNGQYFILKQEASTAEEPSGATGGSKSPKQAPENDGDKEYSHLDRSGRGGKPPGVKSEYSTLGST